MLIVDYSWTHPDPAVLRAAGYVGVMRYLARKVDAKLLQAAERDALHAAGLGIGLVWETTASRAGDGEAAGIADALTAEGLADGLGAPRELPIFYAVDFDATAAQVAPYFDGVRANARRPVGLYGSFRIVEGVDVDWYWQCAAWSRGRISDRAHLYQRIGAPVPGTDENRVYRPLPLWIRGGVTKLNPVKGRITSRFALKRKNPATGVVASHLGVDIANAMGTPIRAVAAGKVKATRTDSFNGDPTASSVLPGRTGNGVLLVHAGFSTYYGHVSTVLVNAGDEVAAGQTIALMGDTGRVIRPQVHFEVHEASPVDPEAWFRAWGGTLGVDPYSLEYIREVQRLLNTRAGAGLLVDGDLGPKTVAAVQEYQAAHGLVVDGDPGPKTLASLRGTA